MGALSHSYVGSSSVLPDMCVILGIPQNITSLSVVLAQVPQAKKAIVLKCSKFHIDVFVVCM